VLNTTYRNHGSRAEAIEIVFDPEELSYRELLEFFFQVHASSVATSPRVINPRASPSVPIRPGAAAVSRSWSTAGSTPPE
jgi:hypothetical protein